MARRTEKLACSAPRARPWSVATVGICVFLGACFTSTPQLPTDHSSKRWIISGQAEADAGTARSSAAPRTIPKNTGARVAAETYAPRPSLPPGQSDLTPAATLGLARERVDVVASLQSTDPRSSTADAAPSASSPPTDVSVGFETLVGKARVLDAVHLDIDDYRVRLQGVSVAKTDSSCGAREGGDMCAAARKWLTETVHGRETRCEGRRHSPSAPLIAVCSIKDRTINADMIRAGLARADAGAFPSYAAEESEARRRKIGLWRSAPPTASAGN